MLGAQRAQAQGRESAIKPDEPYRLRNTRINGVPCQVFAENHACLADLLQAFKEHADKDLLVHEGQRHSYADIARQAARLAAHLAQAGIAAGARVGVALPNSPEWIIAFVALAALGAVPVLINPRAAQAELRHALLSTDCALWFSGERGARRLPPSISTGRMAEICNDTADLPLPHTPRGPQDEAILMFTSGTTGQAKAAVLSHLGLMTALKTIQYSGTLIARQMANKYGIDEDTLLRMRPPPVTLLTFPLFHVSGCHAVFLSALPQGGKLVLLPKWSAAEALRLIQQERVTAFPGVPTMHWDLLRAPELASCDTSSLTSLSVGGQATPPALLQAIHAAFPTAVLGTGYGMTETNGTVTLAVGDAFLASPESSGKVVATMEVQIRDDAGALLPAGEAGEIHVRGAALMSGYANAPGPFFDAQGWFATGDIGQLDADNALRIVDRRTDMVISGGENIYCAEVERALDLHPGVRESAAFGLPDERLGEKLVALVALHPGALASQQDILAQAASQLTKHKVPKEVRICTEPLPRNPSGKVLKGDARARYLDMESAT